MKLEGKPPVSGRWWNVQANEKLARADHLLRLALRTLWGVDRDSAAVIEEAIDDYGEVRRWKKEGGGGLGAYNRSRRALLSLLPEDYRLPNFPEAPADSLHHVRAQKQAEAAQRRYERIFDSYQRSLKHCSDKDARKTAAQTHNVSRETVRQALIYMGYAS